MGQACGACLISLSWLRRVGGAIAVAAESAQYGTTASHVALLIGESHYRHEKYPALCTRNDVDLLQNTLQDKGFMVDVHLDCSLQDLSRTVDAFVEHVRNLKDSIKVVVVYFGGHAVEHNGHNKLLCVDSDPECPNKDIDLDNILKNLGDAMSTETKTVVILDCCRTKTKTLTPLSRVVNFPRRGQFYIAFACGTGQRARERNGYGVFTSAVVDFIGRQPYFSMTSEGFTSIHAAVSRATLSFQRPELLCSASKPWEKVGKLPSQNQHFAGRKVAGFF